MTGTPEENKAVVVGSISLFGTYTVDEAAKTIIYKVESSTFPNWDGHELKRTITSLTDDELKYINPAVSVGGRAETVWRRLK